MNQGWKTTCGLIVRGSDGPRMSWPGSPACREPASAPSRPAAWFPQPAAALALARAFGCTVEDLFRLPRVEASTRWRYVGLGLALAAAVLSVLAGRSRWQNAGLSRRSITFGFVAPGWLVPGRNVP